MQHLALRMDYSPDSRDSCDSIAIESDHGMAVQRRSSLTKTLVFKRDSVWFRNVMNNRWVDI